MYLIDKVSRYLLYWLVNYQLKRHFSIKLASLDVFSVWSRRMIGIYSKRTVEPESARQKLSERHARFPRARKRVTFVVIAYNTRQNTHFNRIHDTKTKITRNRETGEREKREKELNSQLITCLASWTVVATLNATDTCRHWADSSAATRPTPSLFRLVYKHPGTTL